MRRRRLAFAMAVMMTVTSVPTSGLHVSADEVIAEDFIVEEAEISADSIDDENLTEDISSAEVSEELSEENMTFTEEEVFAESVVEEEIERLTEDELESIAETETEAEILEEEFLLDVQTMEETEVKELLTDDGTAAEAEKEIVSLSFNSWEQYLPFDMEYTMQSMRLYITYSDETTEDIVWWSDSRGSYDDEGNFVITWYQKYTENGDTLKLELLQNGSPVKITNKDEYFEPGEYTFRAYWIENDSVFAEKEVTIFGPQENTSELIFGEETEYEVSYCNPQWFYVKPQQTSEYVFDINSKTGDNDIYIEVAEVGENGLRRICKDESWWGTGRLEAELEAGKTYALALSADSNPGSDSGTVEVHRKKTVTGISFSQEIYSYSFISIQEGLENQSVTVTYDDGSSSVFSEWQNNGYWNDGVSYISLEADAGDEQYIILNLTDESGNVIDIPEKEAVKELGSFKMNAYLESDTSIAAQCELNIIAAGEDDSKLELGATAPVSVLQDEKKVWIFDAVQSGSYKLTVYIDEYDACFKLYEVTGNQVTLLQKQEWIYAYETAFSAQSGSRYVICLSNEYEDITGILGIQKVREITGISLLQDSYEYSLMEVGKELENLQIEVNYGDGSSKRISDWSTSWNSGKRILRADVGEGQYIEMYLKKDDGTLVAVPKKYSYTSKIFGSYSLVIELYSNETICDVAELTINGIPEDTKKLVRGEKADFAVAAKSKVLMTFEVEEDGTYVLESAKNSGTSVRVNLYEARENALTIQKKFMLYDEEQNYISVKSGKTYVICLDNMNKKEVTASVKVRPQKQAASVEIEKTAEYDIFSAPAGLADTAVKIIYTDGTYETINAWETKSYWPDSSSSRYYELVANTAEMQYYYIRMQDEQGNPVDINKNEHSYKPVGTYTLTVYDETAATEAVQTVTITLPDAEMIATDDAKESTVCTGERLVYSFAVSEGEEGDYYFNVKADKAEFEAAIYAYDETKRAVALIGGTNAELSAGTYYLTAKCVNSDLKNAPCTACIEKTQEILSVDLITEGVYDELIEGLDKSPLTKLSARITYVNGTEEIVEDNHVGSYNNAMRAVFYKYNADGSVNYKKDYRYTGTLSSGTYYMAAVVTAGTGEVYRSGIPVQVISKKDAAAQNVISSTNNPITLNGTNTRYTCVSYTAETSGGYLIKPDRYLRQIKVFDSKNELEGQWVDDYSVRVELTAGVTYVIAVYSGSAESFSLEVVPEKPIVDAQVTYTKEDLIAGLDEFTDYDFMVELDFGDGETISLNGNDSYADGNGFDYEIVNTETGEIVNTYQSLKAGTYQITAVQRTGSAVYRTGSGIYRTGSVITSATEPLRSNPITITVAATDVSTLTELEEEKEYTLHTSAKRMLYAFTPQKNAVYMLDTELGFTEWSFCKKTEDGLKAVYNQLTAGETYVLVIPSVNLDQTVKVTSALSELRTDAAAEGWADAYDTVDLFFTPETTGVYQFKAELPETSGSFEFEVVGEYTEYEENEKSTDFSAYLMAGISYHVRLYNYSDSIQAYQINVGYEPIKESRILDSFTVSAHLAEGYYAEYADYYAEADLFDITLNYTDGTSAAIELYTDDGYGNYAGLDGYAFVSYTDTGMTYRYDIYVNDEKQQVDITFKKKGTEDYLETGKKTESELADSRHHFYRFVPEKSGEYYFETERLNDYSLYFHDKNIWETRTGVYELQAGVSYLIGIRSWGEDEIGTAFSITPMMVNAVEKMKLLTNAEPFIYGIQSAGDEMTAEVSYADGTTAVIHAGMGRDEYGNDIIVETRALTNGRRRVYLQCGTRRVFCDVDAFDYSTLLQMKTGECSWINIADYGIENLILFSFVPEKAGTYTYSFYANGKISYGSTFLYDTKTMKFAGSPTILTAGRQYVLGMYILEADAEQAGVMISGGSYQGAGCEMGIHTFLQYEYNNDATCTSDGTETSGCEYCAAKDTRVKAGTALGHSWAETGRTAATCTKNGSISYKCTNSGCTETKTTSIPATGKHDLKTVVDKAATCGEAGSQHVECKNCDYKEAATAIPATGKHMLETVVDEKATCGAAGSQHAECKNCDYKEAATVIPATGKHTLETVVDEKATCGTAGSQHVECKNCDYKETATEIPATGKHSYGDYEITKEATALAEGEETRTCSVCGHEERRTVDKLEGTIKLTTSNIPLQVKKSVNLKQVVTGLAKGDKIKSWKSGKKSVATVSKSGKVTAKKVGTATITVTLESGVSAKIKVKVQKKAVTATKISNVKNVTLSLKNKKSFKLEPIVTPISTLQKITYSSNKKSVVTVSKSGVLKAKKKGTAKITIKCGNKKKTITVKVTK